jgi:hypothetical protein
MKSKPKPCSDFVIVNETEFYNGYNPPFSSRNRNKFGSGIMERFEGSIGYYACFYHIILRTKQGYFKIPCNKENPDPKDQIFIASFSGKYKNSLAIINKEAVKVAIDIVKNKYYAIWCQVKDNESPETNHTPYIDMVVPINPMRPLVQVVNNIIKDTHDAIISNDIAFRNIFNKLKTAFPDKFSSSWSRSVFYEKSENDYIEDPIRHDTLW